MSDLRILIVEDDPLIAEDIAQCLRRRDFAVTDVLYDTAELRQTIDQHPPDIVLLDINLQGRQEGIEAAKVINTEYRLPFVYITSYSDRMTLEKARETEPSGYIVKPFTEAGLYAAVEIAYHNHAQKLKHHYPDLFLRTLNQHLADPLSQREFDVIQLIYEGFANQQIADKLFVSSNTVKAHIKNAYFKLDTTSRATTIARLRKLMTMP